jgi:hypothetical protein
MPLSLYSFNKFKNEIIFLSSFSIIQNYAGVKFNKKYKDLVIYSEFFDSKIGIIKVNYTDYSLN